MTDPGYRILKGEDLVEPSDHPHIALTARQWVWVGCTCRPLGFAAEQVDDLSLKLSVVHDESCPTVGMPTAFSETTR